MGSRLELHEILKNTTGLDNVYYQVPISMQIKYPCVVYKRDNEDVKYANNKKYITKKKYTITVIDKNPDSIIPDKIGELPLCTFDRRYTAENLYHDVYYLYY